MAAPTPPVVFDANREIIGGNPYGSRAASDYTTWGKIKCAAIVDPAPGIGQFGYSVGSNSLVLTEGFRPDGSHLFKVERWPYTYLWFDGTSYQTGHAGPHLGFNDFAPGDSYISIGGYNVPDTTGGGPNAYRPYDNLLDENDCANFWEGRLVNSAYTTDADFCNSDPATNLTEYGQNIGPVGFGGYGSISDMTAF